MAAVEAAMFWLVLCSLWAAQPGAGAPETLAKIKQSVLGNLRTLPNYTCTQVIERSYRWPGGRSFENVDRVRLEIGYIDGKELFGWPGGEKLAEEDLHRLVSGAITNGDYALVARALFGGPNVAIGELREENHAGRATLRCDFTAPLQGSDWILAIGERYVPTGYHGSFWVDSNSLQLLELRMTADNVPSGLGYKTVSRDLQFEAARIGRGGFLLPSRAEFRATTTSGAELRNDTRFQDCRQYTAESVISFGPSDTGPQRDAPAPGAAPAAVLPDEFEAGLELDSPIDSNTSAVGDPITAHLLESIKRKGETVIPRGAVLHGRIARLEVEDGHRYADFAFTWFEAGGGRVEIGGRTNELVTLARGFRAGRPLESVTGPIRATGSHLFLPRGFPFRLKSAAAAGQ